MLKGQVNRLLVYADGRKWARLLIMDVMDASRVEWWKCESRQPLSMARAISARF